MLRLHLPCFTFVLSSDSRLLNACAIHVVRLRCGLFLHHLDFLCVQYMQELNALGLTRDMSDFQKPSSVVQDVAVLHMCIVRSPQQVVTTQSITDAAVQVPPACSHSDCPSLLEPSAQVHNPTEPKRPVTRLPWTSGSSLHSL